MRNNALRAGAVNARSRVMNTCAVGAQRRGIDGDVPSAMIRYVMADMTPYVIAYTARTCCGLRQSQFA